MSETSPKITLFGTRGSASAYQIRDFLHRCDAPFNYVELRTDEQARKEAQVDGLNDPPLPVCVFPNGTRMEHTLRQITEKLGWFQNPSRAEYDLSIYGAGSAGLSAAVYGASEGLKTVLVERFALGGQAGSSPCLGFRGELAERAREQAVKFGAEIRKKFASSVMRPGTWSPDPTYRPTVIARQTGRSIVIPIIWKRICPECLRPAMSAITR